ncbi:hypothetical protein AVEN_54524-1 [Araneus ventricosus]|uniref:Uncharacterized protein n=1 Tax=Araneus ventricosus TaxID=182803 RepID=A0A4Y2EKB7_ARAVE|nr:hypothetical protein AVEN_54524-1 [Araneus ventricosus]
MNPALCGEAAAFIALQLVYDVSNVTLEDENFLVEVRTKVGSSGQDETEFALTFYSCFTTGMDSLPLSAVQMALSQKKTVQLEQISQADIREKSTNFHQFTFAAFTVVNPDILRIRILARTRA